MSTESRLRVVGPDDDPYGDIEIHTDRSVAGGRRIAKLWQDDAPCHDYNAEQWAFARRMTDCHNACAGLTPEQVAAIPRLVAWFRDPTCQINNDECNALTAIYQRSPGGPDT